MWCEKNSSAVKWQIRTESGFTVYMTGEMSESETQRALEKKKAKQ
jgi:hypothetical protein